MNFIKYFISAILLVLIGCSSSGPKSTNYGLDKSHQEQNVKVSKKIFVDEKFSEEELGIIKESTFAWENMSKGIISFDVVPGFSFAEKNTNSEPMRYLDKIMIKKSYSKDILIKNIDESINRQLSAENGGKDMQAVTLGYTKKEKEFEFIFLVVDRLVYANGHINHDFYKSVTMHELGHELGMEHFEDGPSIMNVMFEYRLALLTGTKRMPLTCLTKFDALQFCTLYTCNWEDLNYCR